MAKVTISFTDVADGTEMEVDFDPPFDRKGDESKLTNAQLLGLQAHQMLSDYIDNELEYDSVEVVDKTPVQ